MIIFGKIKRFYSKHTDYRRFVFRSFCWIFFIKIVTSLFTIKNYQFLLNVKKKYNPSNIDVNFYTLLNKLYIFVPWRMTCLNKSVCSKFILNKYGIDCKLYLGVYKEQESLKAHAWTQYEDNQNKNNIIVATYE